MTKTITIAPVRKTVTVECSQTHAFEVFTDRIDAWWPKDHHIGKTPVLKEIVEPRAGGRWYTTHEDGSEVITGHVLVWDPPKRLVFTWEISSKWEHEPNRAYASEIEVRFIADGPDRTRVDLEHRDFERMPDREGAEAMRKGVDGGWPGILELFVKAAQS